MSEAPSPTETNGQVEAGRDARGRFAGGNKFAVGNPHAREVATLREVMLNVITERDIRTIVGKLIL